MNAVTASKPACDNVIAGSDFTEHYLYVASAHWCDASPPPLAIRLDQEIHVGAPPGSTPPPHFPYLYNREGTATEFVRTAAPTKLNDTSFQEEIGDLLFSYCAVNDSSMEARTNKNTKEYFRDDISAPLELRLPLPVQEQIAPPEPAEPDWKRPRRRTPNVLTDEQKRNIYRKMPPGWEPLADNEIWALNPETLHNITGAHITTCRRWLRQPPPEMVVRLACILIGGDLGAINEKWRGWRIGKYGDLVSPELWEFSPGRVRTAALTWNGPREQIHAAEQRAREAAEQLDRMRQADFIERRWVDPDETKVPSPEEQQQTLSAAAVQSRPDEERERERRRRYFFWRQRERINNAYHEPSRED